jgi:hypothetical protein
MLSPIDLVSSSWLVAFFVSLLLCLMVPSCQQKVKPPVDKVTIAVSTLPHATLLHVAHAKICFAVSVLQHPVRHKKNSSRG